MKNLKLSFWFLLLILSVTKLRAQSFSANWPFVTDSLSVVSGNITASGAYINPSLFRISRLYGVTGLTGTGTAGLSVHPSCNATYDSVGTITPYLELSFAPNNGFNAVINGFSFKVTAGTLTSVNMLIAAGYSTDNGLTFTGFNISKNNTPITPSPGTTGTSLATNDSLVFSAPSLNINTGDTFKVRLI